MIHSVRTESRDSSVGIATCYGLDGPGIEFRWSRDFPHRPDRPWSPPSLLQNGYRVSFLAVKRPRCGAKHPPSPTAEVKKRVELYLYSLSGLSCSVLKRTLFYFFIIRTTTTRDLSGKRVLRGRSSPSRCEQILM